ncbi:MAG: phosphate/phosphite/phosphonate ABC transporter substrate-binding protein [Betaproteobacteria bacterium]|nr:phosphate/phosphite/phosphonate ABC transporter substrate-binding protein [Betaproteobacteria bacterium]
MRKPLLTMLALAASLAAAGAQAADTCKNRGDLDERYCDENRDLVADTPKDPKQWKDPPFLLFTYSPLEDPAVYEKLLEPYVDHLKTCTGKRIHFYSVLSNAAAIEAMRSGRMHLGLFSTGDTAFAVNLAGAVPFAIRGDAKGPQGYQLWTMVKANSPYQKLSDLAGKKVAHVSPSSNSGNLAPRALMSAEGLTPDKDYKVLYSGRHENSVTGVSTGDYDAAHVASDVVLRMEGRGLIKPGELRALYRSSNFPPGGMSMAHDLKPELQKKIRECVAQFKYSPEMVKAFQGADRWWPVEFQRDWAAIRKVAAATGEAYDRRALEREQQKAKK